MRQPCCHIAAVGHAFILFDFLRGILPEAEIGKVKKGYCTAAMRLLPLGLKKSSTREQVYSRVGFDEIEV